MNGRIVFLLLFGYLFAPAAAGSDYNEGSNHFDTFTMYWENDVFANTDRNYTNGLKLTWSTPFLAEGLLNPRLPGWSYPVINHLPFVSDPYTQRAVSVSIGQNIYTPEDTQEKKLIKDDRPYAGYTYIAAAFHNRDARRQNTWEFDVGVVGPCSAAEQSQSMVHDVIESTDTNGWNNQLGNEVVVEVVCESKWKLFQSSPAHVLEVDAHYHLGGHLGNTFTYANTGLEFRFGWLLPENFGSCPIRAGCEASHAFTDDAMDIGHRKRLNAHFFMGVDGRYVMQNIFLDGTTFQDSHRVNKEPFVADIIAGIGLKKGRFQASYAYVYRTKEFETQEKPQVFGAVIVSFLL